MKISRKLGLPGLLLAATLALASCGGDQGVETQARDGGESTQVSGQATPGTASGETSGMEMGGTTGGMPGTDHGSTSPDEAARQLVAPNGEYSDAAFVNAMIPHHEEAVEMAEVAVDNAEHEEIRALAKDIVDSQGAEIKILGQKREDLGGATTGMSGEEMDRMMGMSENPQALARKRPFDRAFIDAMIPHHESAIAMANVALEQSEDPQILRIAGDIVTAQEGEISEMRGWREDWYPQG